MRIQSVTAAGTRGGIASLSIEARISNFVDRHLSVVYVAPSLLVLGLLFAVPIVMTVYLSFTKWNFSVIRGPVFIGLQNYVDLIQEPRFHDALITTVEFTTLALLLELPLGMLMALLLNREFGGRSVYRTLFMFPMMATPVASMISWRLILDPAIGIISFLNTPGRTPFVILGNQPVLVPTFAIIDTWQWTPFVALILMAGLSSLPSEPFEAAIIDGASKWQSFWYVTLPLLRPVILVVVMFRMIDCLKVYETIFVLTQGSIMRGTETLNIYAYRESFEYYHMGYASSLLIVFFMIVFAATILLMRLRRAQ